MSLRTKMKTFIFNYALFTAFILSTALYHSVFAGDDNGTTIADLNARIDDLEQQIAEGGEKVDDANPGKRVTPEELERIKEDMRALRGTSDDMSRLRDELSLLHEDMKQLKKENADLRKQKAPKKEAPPSDMKEDASLDSVEEKPLAKKKEESWKQTPSSSSKAPASDLDDEMETESVLKILEKSAPGVGDDDAEVPPTKIKKKNNADLEVARDAATRRAEETAPRLPAGNAEAQYNQAIALHDQGAYAEATSAFDYFISTYPHDPLVPKALYWKAESCYQLKNYKDAKVFFVKSFKQNPSGPKAPDCLLKLGEVLAIQGNKNDACTAWRKLETDFTHMTPAMKTELTTLKKTYGCVKKSANAPKPDAGS